MAFIRRRWLPIAIGVAALATRHPVVQENIVAPFFAGLLYGFTHVDLGSLAVRRATRA